MEVKSFIMTIITTINSITVDVVVANDNNLTIICSAGPDPIMPSTH